MTVPSMLEVGGITERWRERSRASLVLLCTDMCADTCVDMCKDICKVMCTDMCVDMCKDLCIVM